MAAFSKNFFESALIPPREMSIDGRELVDFVLIANIGVIAAAF